MKKYLVIFAFSLLLYNCHEVFEPETENVETFPVIEGFFSTIPGPHYISIKYSTGYNQSTIGPGITGASVYVTSLEKDFVQFQHAGQGIYKAILDSNTIAKVGHTYTLSVYTPDGEVYVSIPQTVQACPEIEKVYCVYKVSSLLTEDAYGRTKEEDLDGMEVRFKTNGLPGENSHFTYKYKGYEQHHVIYQPYGAATAIHSYSHRSLSNRYLNEIKTINVNDFGNLKKVDDKLIFIAERDMEYFEHGLDLTTTKLYLNRFEGLIMKLQQFSISSDAYEAYHSFEKMLGAEGSLFDPPVPEIISNIDCTSDSTKKVVGVFSAVDISTYYTYLYTKNGKAYQLKLDSMPELFLDEDVGREPATWIDIPF